MSANLNANRPKRIRKTLSLLKRNNRRLRTHLRTYRVSALALGAMTLVLGAVLGFVTVADSPDPVLLGRGTAGLMVDSLDVVDPGTSVGGDSIASGESDLGSGEASYYGDELAGRPTASGESFDPAGLTAAHRTLPIGSRVRVTNVRNGKSVVVRINDRGPFTADRVIDLSSGAANQIGMLGAGTALVRLHLLDR